MSVEKYIGATNICIEERHEFAGHLGRYWVLCWTDAAGKRRQAKESFKSRDAALGAQFIRFGYDE